MKNIIMTRRVPCTHEKCVAVLEPTFDVRVSFDKENTIEIDFGYEVDTTCISTSIEIDDENVAPLHETAWWCGFYKYNLGASILDIITSTIAEQLSGSNEEEYGNVNEIDLDLHRGIWEEKANEYLAEICKKEYK